MVQYTPRASASPRRPIRSSTRPASTRHRLSVLSRTDNLSAYGGSMTPMPASSNKLANSRACCWTGVIHRGASQQLFAGPPSWIAIPYSCKKEVIQHPPPPRFAFSFKYSSAAVAIKRAINENWDLLKGDPSLNSFSNQRPLVTFRRCHTLKDKLVKSVYSTPQEETWLRKPRGNHKCGHCSFCTLNTCSKGLEIGGIKHVVRDFINCRTSYVVYVVFCPCKRFYIGKTIRPLFERIREHVGSIRSGRGCPRLIEHIRTSHDAHPHCLSFAGVEHVRPIPRGVDRHRLLLQREARWIMLTGAMGAAGLNERNDISVFL
ncbi:T-cell leukemia homeobox protein 1 isoform X1 [Bufo gargarizans]|uniref:T-cell leukemia homeobox protein 1 isoform X1 n=1 Tax=Bufo gargarizans TaxID=30331 RepID=UPI001CF3E1AE|nr:T-cell leukemia homeobox protein 1 isoform X1 [Bufo gargarizans]